MYYGYDDNQTTETEKKYSQNVIDNYTYQFLGVPNSLDDYNKTIYKVNNSGSYDSKEVTIEDKKQKLGFNKLSIRNEYIKKTRDNINFGIVDDIRQESMFKGWVNRQFINSVSFPYRMKIQLKNLNLSLCSGDCIETNFYSSNSKRGNRFTELSGKWIILETGHGFDANGEAGTSLTIGKPSLDIFKKHKFYKDFI